MQDPFYQQIEGRARPSLTAAHALVLLATAGVWIAGVLVAAFVGDDPRMVAMDLLYYLPFVVMPVALYGLSHRGLSQSLRLNPLPLPAALCAAVLGLLSVYLASALASVWSLLLDALGFTSPSDALATADGARALSLSVITMAAVPAVCEELLFRGFAFAAWESRGTRRAALVTTALFALMHANLYGLPAYALVGLVSCYLVFSLDSLYAGIAYHTVYNAAILLINWLLAGQETETAALSAAEWLGVAVDVAVTAALAALILRVVKLRREANHIEPIPRIVRPMSRPAAALLGATAVLLLAGLAVTTALARLAG